MAIALSATAIILSLTSIWLRSRYQRRTRQAFEQLPQEQAEIGQRIAEGPASLEAANRQISQTLRQAERTAAELTPTD